MAYVSWYDKYSLSSGIAATAIAEGDVVAMDTNGKVALADADADTTTSISEPVGIAMHSAASNAVVTFAKRCRVKGLTGLTVGRKLLLGTTAGAMIQGTIATSHGSICVLGRAITATEALIDIVDAFLKTQASGSTVVTTKPI
jgi:hypothetical protein